MMRRPPAPPMRLALPVLLALSFTLPAQAQDLPLGRLFHTQEERSQLNARRLGSVPGGPQAMAVEPVASEDAASAPEPVQLNGVLQRSNGKSTVWINQQAQSGGSKVLRDRSVSLQLPSGKRVILKPGQSYDESDGTVRDATR